MSHFGRFFSDSFGMADNAARIGLYHDWTKTSSRVRNVVLSGEEPAAERENE